MNIIWREEHKTCVGKWIMSIIKREDNNCSLYIGRIDGYTLYSKHNIETLEEAKERALKKYEEFTK
jgi:hypothetical protein